MKKITYTDKAKSSEGVAPLQKTTKLLDEVIGPAAEAEWDRTEDATGRTLYTLRITDGAESASTSFEPDELQSFLHMRVRLYGLWGEVLQAQTHKLLQGLADSGE